LIKTELVTFQNGTDRLENVLLCVLTVWHLYSSSQILLCVSVGVTLVYCD